MYATETDLFYSETEFMNIKKLGFFSDCKSSTESPVGADRNLNIKLAPTFY
jgi:hypothetical protein